MESGGHASDDRGAPRTGALPMTSLALLAALTLASSAPHATKSKAPMTKHETRPCKMVLSGAVQAKVDCTMSARFTKGFGLYLLFTPTKLSKGVSALMAGPFDLKGPVEAKVPYPASAFLSGRAMLSTARHATYGAEVGKTPRGDLAVQFDSIVASAAKQPAETGDPREQGRAPEHDVTASGTLTATLVPSKGTGDANLVVTF
jgi:hypothetical protein